jgi:hypothetical protein
VKIILFALLFSFIGTADFAQEKKISKAGSRDSTSRRLVYTVVEEMPEPLGGIEKLNGLIFKKLKIPNTGSTYATKIAVSFIIEPNGSINDKTVINDSSGSQHLFTDQVFKIVDSVKWKPGSQNGKAVPTRYSLPITICLSSDD